jgi:hypothetical protein
LNYGGGAAILVTRVWLMHALHRSGCLAPMARYQYIVRISTTAIGVQ